MTYQIILNAFTPNGQLSLIPHSLSKCVVSIFIDFVISVIGLKVINCHIHRQTKMYIYILLDTSFGNVSHMGFFINIICLLWDDFTIVN